jgi:arogenate dehydrogenase (NADP+)
MENHNTEVEKVLVDEDEVEDSKLSIGIIGFGTFGQFLAHKFKQNHKVLTTSRTDYSEKCKTLGIEYYRDYRSFFSQKIDVLVISVSIISFDKVLKGIVKYLKDKNILVVDVLSVKMYPRNLMLDFIPESCDIIAAHPMFGPKSSLSLNWTNNNLVYEPVRCNTKNRVSKFIKIFKQCNIYILNCEKHDQIVAETQFITHYIGKLLQLLDLKSYNINTNTYKMLLDIKTILNRDNNELFIGMYQYNKYTRDIITKINRKIQDIDI